MAESTTRIRWHQVEPTVRRWAPVLVVLLGGLIVTTLAYVVAARMERQRMQSAFELVAKNHISAIRRQMQSDFEVVRSLAAFYAGSQNVERDEFLAFSRPLLEDHPAIRALEWAPRVEHHRRAAFEEEARVAGLLDYQVTDRDGEGRQVPSPERAEYYPVYYIASVTNNSRVLGFDLAGDETRRRVIEAAGAAGDVVASPRVELVQQKHAFGCLVVHPVHGGRDAGEGDQPKLQGVVLGVVDIEVMVNKALSYLSSEPLFTYLFDATAGGGEDLLASHSYDRARPPPHHRADGVDMGSPTHWRHVEHFDLAGRRWSVSCAGLPAFAAGRQNWHHWGVGGTGLLLTLLLTAHLATVAGRSRRVEQLVVVRTGELATANQELRREITERQQAQLALEITQAELGLARRVQLGLLPLTPPVISGIDIAGASFPASRVSGDHFDFINVDNEQLGIVIGDASGHGLGAAMLMVEIRACVRAAANLNHRLPDILSITNRVVTDGMPDGRFVTLLLAAYDPVNRGLIYANAGHPSGFVLDAAGRIRHSLKSQCMPLGIDSQIVTTVSEAITLEEGDLVLLMTDGVLDAMSPANAAFGEKRVLALVQRFRDQPAATIIERLHEAILAHCGDRMPHDDMTVVIVKVAGALTGQIPMPGKTQVHAPPQLVGV